MKKMKSVDIRTLTPFSVFAFSLTPFSFSRV